jgi:hypothetical protein
VENIIYFFFRQKNEIRNVVFDEPEIFVPGEMSNVRRVTGDQIINGNDTMTLRQKSVHQMRAEETRTASNDGNGMGVFGGHCALLSNGYRASLPAGSQGMAKSRRPDRPDILSWTLKVKR